jgi:hypothetical protein
LKADEINRIMSEEEEILPSSGFFDSVMSAVRSEAAAPPAIPFPWKRALPLFVVGGIALVALVLYGVSAIAGAGAASAQSTSSLSYPMFADALFAALGGWISVACLVSLASVMFSLRLAFSRS